MAFTLGSVPCFKKTLFFRCRQNSTIWTISGNFSSSFHPGSSLQSHSLPWVYIPCLESTFLASSLHSWSRLLTGYSLRFESTVPFLALSLLSLPWFYIPGPDYSPATHSGSSLQSHSLPWVYIPCLESTFLVQTTHRLLTQVRVYSPIPCLKSTFLASSLHSWSRLLTCYSLRFESTVPFLALSLHSLPQVYIPCLKSTFLASSLHSWSRLLTGYSLRFSHYLEAPDARVHKVNDNQDHPWILLSAAQIGQLWNCGNCHLSSTSRSTPRRWLINDIRKHCHDRGRLNHLAVYQELQMSCQSQLLL